MIFGSAKEFLTESARYLWNRWNRKGTSSTWYLQRWRSSTKKVKHIPWIELFPPTRYVVLIKMHFSSRISSISLSNNYDNDRSEPPVLSYFRHRIGSSTYSLFNEIVRNTKLTSKLTKKNSHNDNENLGFLHMKKKNKTILNVVWRICKTCSTVVYLFSQRPDVWKEALFRESTNNGSAFQN